MADRPSIDDLKQARDGHQGAGRPPPTCLYCDEEMTRAELIEAVRMHVDGVDKETGRRFGRTAYAHPECHEEKGES